jgi:hypothetical protein
MRHFDGWKKSKIRDLGNVSQYQLEALQSQESFSWEDPLQQ